MTSNDVKVFYTNNEEPFSNEQWSKYWKVIPHEFARRVEKYRRWQDRQNAITGRLLLQKGLSDLNWIKNSVDGDGSILDIVEVTKKGKPYLPIHALTFYRKIFFNISHSGKYVLCAIHNMQVGIDIEKKRDVDHKQFRSILTAKEMEKVETASNLQSEFYTIWTRKESVVKGAGLGLSAGLSSVCVAGRNTVLNGETWYFVSFHIDDDYASHVSTLISSPSVSLRFVQF